MWKIGERAELKSKDKESDLSILKRYDSTQRFIISVTDK